MCMHSNNNSNMNVKCKEMAEQPFEYSNTQILSAQYLIDYLIRQLAIQMTITKATTKNDETDGPMTYPPQRK